ncbi:hypothetical protein L3X38_031906 [Prunus dulcis]|uniref:Uncharacterized protein n=1 Tax=Prunus dulcis TaxID=3755 RepID=A0AAD4VEH3_PRUDU|nr:hypothetical protein L3X38_031906 [Prunus dulcis]
MSQEEFNRHPYELKHLQSTHPYNYADYVEEWYKVPWILKWSYHVNWKSRIMSRQLSVKWWDKFKVDRIEDYVYRDFSEVTNPLKPEPVSPVGSTHSSLSIEGKSKSELQELARQLILQASQMDDDEDRDATPKSLSSTNQLPNSQQRSSQSKRWADYQDSQDPYDLESD